MPLIAVIAAVILRRRRGEVEPAVPRSAPDGVEALGQVRELA